jgi:hypothetical protein
MDVKKGFFSSLIGFPSQNFDNANNQFSCSKTLLLSFFQQSSSETYQISIMESLIMKWMANNFGRVFLQAKKALQIFHDNPKWKWKIEMKDFIY